MQTLDTPLVLQTETPEFGLSSRALGLLRGLFASYPEVQRAIVYGSRAIGN